MGTKTVNETNSNGGKEISPIARLIQIGRDKSFVTLNDILLLFPHPEQNLQEVDRAFASLISAGIPIHRPDHFIDPSEEEQ